MGGGGGGAGVSQGIGTQPALFRPGSSKIEVLKLIFLIFVTTHNDHPSYVKHVLSSIYVFFYPYLGIGCALLGGTFCARWTYIISLFLSLSLSLLSLSLSLSLSLYICGVRVRVTELVEPVLVL